MYKVRFYIARNGRSPIKDFIDSAQKSLRAKVTKQINTLQQFDLTVENPYLRKVSGTPLWESRILGKDSTRIICVTVVNKEIVIIHIFRKKDNKMSSRDLKISLKRYKEELDK